MTGTTRCTEASKDFACCTAPKNGLLWEPVLAQATEGFILSAVCPVPVVLQPGAGSRLEEDDADAGPAKQIRLTLAEFAPFAQCRVNVFLPVRAADFGANGLFAQELVEAAAWASVHPSRVVLDLCEPTPAALPAVLEAAEGLRSTGMRISLGPGGTFESAVETLLELRPDFVRVGAPIVGRCSSDFFRQAVLEAVCELAWKFGATILAGGVETEPDLAMLRTLGIRLVHGDLFGPPVPQSILLDPAVPGRFRLPDSPRPTTAESPR